MLKQSRSILVNSVRNKDLIHNAYNQLVPITSDSAQSIIDTYIADGFVTVDVSEGLEKIQLSTEAKALALWKATPCGIYNFDYSLMNTTSLNQLVIMGVEVDASTGVTAIQTPIWLSNWQQSINPNSFSNLLLRFGNWNFYKQDGRLNFSNLNIQDSQVHIKGNTVLNSNSLTRSEFIVKNYFELTNGKTIDFFNVETDESDGFMGDVGSIVTSTTELATNSVFIPESSNKWAFVAFNATTNLGKLNLDTGAYCDLTIAMDVGDHVGVLFSYQNYIFLKVDVYGPATTHFYRYNVSNSSFMRADYSTAQSDYDEMVRSGKYMYFLGNTTILTRYDVASSSILDLDTGYKMWYGVSAGNSLWFSNYGTQNIIKYVIANTSISAIDVSGLYSSSGTKLSNITYDGNNNIYAGTHSNSFGDSPEADVMRLNISTTSASLIGADVNNTINTTSYQYKQLFFDGVSLNLAIADVNYNADVFTLNLNTFELTNIYLKLPLSYEGFFDGDYNYYFKNAANFGLKTYNMNAPNLYLNSPAFQIMEDSFISATSYQRLNVDIKSQYEYNNTLLGIVTRNNYSLSFMETAKVDDSLKKFNGGVNWIIKREDIESTLTTDFSISGLTMYGSSAGTYSFRYDSNSDENFFIRCSNTSSNDISYFQWYNGGLKNTVFSDPVSASWKVEDCFQIWDFKNLSDIKNLINMTDSPLVGSIVFNNWDNEVIR